MAAEFSTRKKIAFSLVLLAFLWAMAELACLGGLWYLKRYKNVEYQPKVVEDLNDKHKGILAAQIADTSSYMVFDPELGWTIRPNGNKPQYQANSKGLPATGSTASASLRGRSAWPPSATPSPTPAACRPASPGRR